MNNARSFTKRDLFAMYFGQIVGIQYHPRNERLVDLEHCAMIAEDMVRVTYAVFDRWERSNAVR